MENTFDSHNLLISIVFFLSASCIAVPLTKKLGLGSVIGFLAAGVVIGPFGLRLFSDTKTILHFAEIGVVFLLFVIGLELNIKKLISMKKSVFGYGTLQVAITGVALAIPLAYFLNHNTATLNQTGNLSLPVATSLILGLTLALSSTAFAIQLLQEKNELQTTHGQASFGILLFQDLAAIPLIAIIPMLGAESGSTNFNIMSLFKALATVTAVLVAGRLLLRHVLRIIAISRIKEVFTAATLLLVIGLALIANSIGLSMALGAFLAGVLLADSEYRHELEADIEPFKGLFLGLFFIAVGMNVNLKILFDQPILVIGATLLLMALKFLAILVTGKIFKINFEVTKKMGVTLAQGGEFAFVLFAMAAQGKILSEEHSDLLTLIVTLSMAFTPLLIILQEKFFCAKVKPEETKNYDKDFEHLEPKVIIAGFGRFGQIVSRILSSQKIPFTTLEHSPENVETARKFGNKLYYGDASRIDLLEAAGAAKAKLFILAIDDVDSSLMTAKIVKDHFPNLKILARARNRQHVFDLMNLGVTIIRRETFASSLEVAEETLNHLGYDNSKSKDIVSRFRQHDEKFLLEQYKLTFDEKLLVSRTREMVQQLDQLLQSDEKQDG